jgi:hypothetical protein
VLRGFREEKIEIQLINRKDFYRMWINFLLRDGATLQKENNNDGSSESSPPLSSIRVGHLTVPSPVFSVSPKHFHCLLFLYSLTLLCNLL